MNDIQERVINVLAHTLFYNKEDIFIDTKLVEDIGCDSIELVEVIMELEKEFNIFIPDQDLLEQEMTVEQLVLQVTEIINKQK
jgi:acyl carrier protein